MKKLTYYYYGEAKMNGVQSEAILYKQERFCSAEQLETELAIAKSISYNGEVTVEEIEEPISQQIQSLKASLSSTDYKIIKCSEAQLVGEELPYDIASLHAERQALRDKINELEQQLKANEEGGAI